MKCVDCEKLDDGYICLWHDEIQRVAKDIKERIRKDFLEEYKWRYDYQSAILISFGSTPLEMKRFSYGGRCQEILKRYRYFKKTNIDKLPRA